MTIWSPDLSARPGPKYLALAECLAEDVTRGTLAPGARLPTHRELAEELDVTVGTVSRGYAEALRRGLITGEVGRGTFVRTPRADHGLGNWLCVPQFSDPSVLCFHLNTPTGDAAEPELRDALQQLAKCPSLSPLLHYQHSAGVQEHREAGVRWLAGMGQASSAEQVIVTAGGQHAILMVFSALMNPGDVVLCEQFAYQGVTNAAHMLNLRLIGVAMDDHGVIPAEFEAACRKYNAKSIYLTPTFQNPTASVMPAERREEIADIAIAHGVAVIEDDIYAFYAEKQLPTLASMVGPLGFFISSMSKSIAPGLRIAFVHGPKDAMRDITDSVWSTTIMAPPLMGAVATILIQNGSIEKIFERRRNLALRRQAMVTERLGEFVASSCDRRCSHVWLELPENWCSRDFVAAAEALKVAVAPAEMFAVGRVQVPHAVRISLVALREDQDDDVARGLDVLADLMHGRCKPRRVAL